MNMARRTALQMGYTHYEGDRPCGHLGHRALRYVSNGACVDCQNGTPTDRAYRRQVKEEARRAESLSVRNAYRGLVAKAGNEITLEERQGLDRMCMDPVWLHAMLYELRNPGLIHPTLKGVLEAVGALDGVVPQSGGITK